MDPRTAWYQPEQTGLAHDIWTSIIESVIGVDNMSFNNPNLDQTNKDFIPLDFPKNLNQRICDKNEQNSFKNDLKVIISNKTYILITICWICTLGSLG